MENAYLIGAWLAIGLAGLWVCIGEWSIAKKSMEVLGKNPELSGTLMVYTILGIALTESAAIYGLIVALNIINSSAELSLFQSLSAWLAIWVTWFAASLWEWRVATQALDSLQRNPAIKSKILTFMILFIALVESAAIYGLIVALGILWK